MIYNNCTYKSGPVNDNSVNIFILILHNLILRLHKNVEQPLAAV